MTKKLILSILLVAVLAVGAFAADYEWVASSPLNAVTTESTTGVVTNFAASSTAILSPFTALANDTTHTHVLVRVSNGTTVYFNPPSVASKSLGLEFTSSDALFCFPLTDEVKSFTILGDAGGETIDYMPITQK